MLCGLRIVSKRCDIDQGELTHAHSRNVPIIVHEIPLARDQVQPQDMVVDFICKLVEASKSVDLVVADVCNGCIDKAGGLGAYGGDHLRFVTISNRFPTAHRAGRHEESVVGGSTAAGRGGEGGRLQRGGDAGGVESSRGKGCSGSDCVCHELRSGLVNGKWVRIWGPLGRG